MRRGAAKLGQPLLQLGFEGREVQLLAERRAGAGDRAADF
jgi:hypothetical protein